MNKKLILLISAMGLATTQFAQAEEYPFALPSTVTATFSINTSAQEVYNNKQLGTNIFGYSSDVEQALINHYNPITVRFPHGLWANWYDWRTDGTRVFGEDSFEYMHASGKLRSVELDFLSNIKQMDSSNKKIGIEGLTFLNLKKKDTTGAGFDMLWTFNMSADGTNFNNGSPETVARYKNLVGRGFEVKDIELGNENFYPGQRGSIIPNASDYIARAKSMSAALKAKDPTIRVSVPLLRRGSAVNPNWNKDLTKDLSYFDAVTVHTYVGSDPDDANSPAGAYGTALTARYHLAASVNDYSQKVAPNKPVWLSEWGVKSGGPNAVSVLGMADAYIFMSENQKTYDRANWFSVNGQLNSFLVWEEYKSPSGAMRPRIKYPLEKTAVGSSYEIIRSVFEDSTLLGSSMNSPDLMAGVDAVSARAVVKDGKTTVFVLNLTDKTVPFSVKLDGSVYGGSFTHKAMSFNTMGAERVLPLNADPLTTIKDGAGQITLPKLSMSTIVLKDVDVQNFSVAVTAPNDKSTFTLGQTIELAAKVSSRYNDVVQVNFRVNGAFLKQDNSAPYAVDWVPTEAGQYTIDTIAITRDGTRLTSEAHTLNIKAAAVSSASRAASSLAASSKAVSSKAASSLVASSKAASSQVASIETASSAPSIPSGCANYIDVVWGQRTEVNLTPSTCLRFNRNLAGGTLQFWDSDTHACDFRGAVTSVNGSGSAAIDSNYVAVTNLSGTTLSFTNSVGNNCAYLKLRVY